MDARARRAVGFAEFEARRKGAMDDMARRSERCENVSNAGNGSTLTEDRVKSLRAFDAVLQDLAARAEQRDEIADLDPRAAALARRACSL